MTDKQLKEIWKELDKLGCSKHITEKIFIKIVKIALKKGVKNEL
jgi:hypothetical protein